jgi:NAD(P)-dependent dehydrogenase (short-subunit alcohol dehydrogenase family)
LYLAGKGILVFAGVRNDKDGQSLVQECGNNKIIPVLLDVEQDSVIDDAAAKVGKILKEKSARLIGIVNNAGIVECDFVELISRERLIEQFNVNLFGSIIVTQKFLPLLRQCHRIRQTRILFISSGLEAVSMVRYGPYSATKHALIALSDALRLELGIWRISVIRVVPGVTNTDMQVNANRQFMERMDASSKEMEEDVFAKYKSVHLSDHGVGISPRVTSIQVYSALYDFFPLRVYSTGKEAWATNWLANIFPRSFLSLS